MSPFQGLGLPAMAVVFLYVFATAPFLPLLLWVHRQQGAYSGLFIAAMVLQLIPIGLVFFPLGFIGVAMLAYTLSATRARVVQLRRSGIERPDLWKQWNGEYLANLLAFGCSLEQKGVALVFIQVTHHQGLGSLWWGLLPASLALWALLAWPIWRAYSSDHKYV